MKKNNIYDIGIGAVRLSGQTNMFSKEGVQFVAYQLGFFELVSWLEDANGMEFYTLLNCINYEKLPSILTEEYVDYLGQFDNLKARMILQQDFQKEIEEANGKSFSNFFEIPYTIEEFVQSEKDLYDFLLEKAPHHPMDYVFIWSETKSHVVKFKQDGYRMVYPNLIYNNEREMKALDVKRWSEINQYKWNEDRKKKYEKINEEIRLEVLLANKTIK